jgi:Tfp pilus assembly protein FimT
MAMRRMRGFSLLEALIVVAIMIVVANFSIMAMRPIANQTRITNAYNTTLMAMRRAREAAIGERRRYLVTFSNGAVPNSVQIVPADALPGGVRATYTLPGDVAYTVVTGLPNQGPDGFGNGSVAIDFDQNVIIPDRTSIYFYPDGSAQDVNNNLNNGVIYVARPSELYSSMAITLWGATGRLRGWRLVNSGGPKWYQQ